MNITVLYMPSLTVLITLIRLLIDILILSIANRYWRRHQIALEATFSSCRIPLEGYRALAFKQLPVNEVSCSGSPIGVISFRPCRITLLRVKILLSDSQDTFAAGAYIDLAGEGDFQSIRLSLPMIISDNTIAKDGILQKENENRNGLVITDQREKSLRTGSFSIRTYRTVAMPFTQTGSSVTVSIPVSCGPFTTGLPMTETKELTLPLPNSLDSVTCYFPAVEKMELILEKPPSTFAFDPLGQAPSPEYYSDKECRWISGTNLGARPHSSISSRLTYGLGEERLQMTRIRDGIGIGIWTAVLVTVSIDLVWVFVELMRSIAQQ